tara:strand:+ start:364 stop:894 length:531 start_codon:yes stop_codon:yes gene_type:complete
MALSRRYQKRIQKVQDMLDGNNTKIVVGNHSVTSNKTRKVGDKWTDSDGVEWEQKQGYISKVSKLPNVGIFRHTCSKCKKGCTASYDKEACIKYDKCYHCQMNWEIDLKLMRIGENGSKWDFWVRLQKLKQWIAGRKELDDWIDEQHKLNSKKAYDMTVANAMANSNISMEIKKNT